MVATVGRRPERDAKAIASTTSLMPYPVPTEIEGRLRQHVSELEDAAERGVTRIMDLLASVAEGEE